MGIRKVVLDAFTSLLQASMGSASSFAAKNWSFSQVPLIAAQTLDDLYDGNDLARRVIDLKPENAFRHGYGFSEPAQLAYDTYGVTDSVPEGMIQRVAKMARLHGGACIVACHEVGAGALDVPLEPDANPGQLLWLDVFSRSELKIVQSNTDPESATPLAPVLFEVTATRRKGLQFHASRALFFMGDMPSPSAFEKLHASFWGASVLQSGYESLLRLGQRDAAVDRLMLRSSTQALQLKGLLDSIAREEQGVLDARLQVLVTGIERTNFVLLDEGESYSPHSVTMTGLDEHVARSEQRVAAAFGYPVTKLFGSSPGGLNATGESDQENFTHELETWLTRITPHLQQLAVWMTGNANETIKIPPLRTPSKKEQTEELTATVAAYDTLDGWGNTDSADLVQALIDKGLIPATIKVQRDAEPSTEENGDQTPPPTT